MKEDDRFKLVYSDLPRQAKGAPGKGKAVIRIERKGRGGKTVTLVEQLCLSQEELRSLLRELQQLCGTGGTLKENHLELQGDVREKIKPRLAQKGYKV